MTEDQQAERLRQMTDAAEMLWVVLANVSGGDWTQQSTEWQQAAARWRDHYFDAVKACDTKHARDAMTEQQWAALLALNAAFSKCIAKEDHLARLSGTPALLKEEVALREAIDAVLEAFEAEREAVEKEANPESPGTVGIRRPGKVSGVTPILRATDSTDPRKSLDIIQKGR